MILMKLQKSLGNSLLIIPQTRNNFKFIIAIVVFFKRKHVSPFALRANKKGFYYVGGKSDDITLILAQVKRFPK